MIYRLIRTNEPLCQPRRVVLLRPRETKAGALVGAG